MKTKVLILMMALFAFAWSAKADEITGLTLTIRHNGGEAFTQSFPRDGWPDLDLTDEATSSLIIQRIEVQTSGIVQNVMFYATMFKTENGLKPDEGWRSFSLVPNGEDNWLLDFGEGIDLIDSEMGTSPRTFQFYVAAQDAVGNKLSFNNGGLDYKVLFVKGEGGSQSSDGIKSLALTINCDGEVFTQSFPKEGWEEVVIDGQTTSLKILKAEVETEKPMSYVGFIATMYSTSDGWQHNEEEWRTTNFNKQDDYNWVIDMGEGFELVEEKWLNQNKTKTFEFFVYAEDSSGKPLHYNNGGQNYKVTFSTGEGGDSNWKVRFYKESTASLSLLVNGEEQSYVFDGDAKRWPDLQPGDAYSLIINGFNVSFIYNDNVKVNDVSLQYKIHEEGQEGWWNRLDAQQYFSESIWNEEKQRTEQRMNCYAYDLWQEVSSGLEYGKNYILDVMYQVVTSDGEYFFLGKNMESTRFRFYYDTETGLKDLKDLKDTKDLNYNLAGQRVGKNHKGIVIAGGRKELRK